MPHEREVPSRHVGQVVHADPSAVYDFASDVANLPVWASGLATSGVRVEGDHLVVDSPMGSVRVRFVARNALGVLDHDVTLPSGTVVHNPFRVLPHPDGSELLFTVRQIELTDEEFARDVETVRQDLERLARHIESLGSAADPLTG
ncbi:SRPBCC family protein [Amnibacterium endophyticum]|uniref:SRPBCC family protein n=1 Tax=Amnibacterium endophyticum TaxID=2109337 RepID=A0ABW4LEK1_9MICO